MSEKSFWQLTQAIDTFFFDCDGTLSLVEGIDELAVMNGVFEEVSAITEKCMSKTGMTPADYRARLNCTRPTLLQVAKLVGIYRENIAAGAIETLQVLQRLGKNVYIISAGIRSAVVEFARTLGVQADHVLAVDVFFDHQGNYQDFDESSFLVQPMGKPKQIAAILQPGEQSLLLGDGLSDWEAHHNVTRFVGFAGLKSKASVKSNARFFINTASIYPVLPLGLMPEELISLSSEEKSCYQRGLADIHNGLVIVKEQAND